MMYYFFDLIDETNKVKRHIFQDIGDGKGFSFPLETNSRHVNEYLAWLAEGNTAEEYKPGETNEQTQPAE